jgi:hypothetical protein
MSCHKNITVPEISPCEFDAHWHQVLYHFPMRIRVSESIAIPSITRESDGSAILNINTDLSFEDIEAFVEDQFEPGEREIAQSLWADDLAERVFTPIDGTTDFFIDLRQKD